MILNVVRLFPTYQLANLWCIRRMELLKERGYTVENFNGLGWIWYGVHLQDATDLGIMLQILSDPNPEEISTQKHMTEERGE